MVMECDYCPAVGRHGVIAEEATDDLRQPFPLLRDRLVHSPSQLLLDLLEFRFHAVAPGLPMNEEFAPATFAADEGEPEEVEGFRFAEPALRTLSRREAAERDQAGLFRMQRQCELPQPFTHCTPEAPGISFMLEADHDIVRVAYDDHVARGLAPSPAFGPEVEDVVQVDFCE